MAWSPLIKQIQMGQDVDRFGVLRQGESPRASGEADECVNSLLVQVLQRRVAAEGGIERASANQLAFFHQVDQARVDIGDEF